MKTNIFPLLISMAFALFCSCTSTRNWHGNDVPGNNTATFDNFNGKTKFKLQQDGHGAFYFKYNIVVEKGSINLALRSPGATVFMKTITTNASDSILIGNPGNEQYTVYIQGEQAKGNFTITYGPAPGSGK